MRYFEVKKPRIEIIPMIDIMLFLLVFFIMIALKMTGTCIDRGLSGNRPDQMDLMLPLGKFVIVFGCIVRSITANEFTPSTPKFIGE